MKGAPGSADLYGMTRMSLLLLERKIDELVSRPASAPPSAKITAARLRRLVSRAV